MGSGDICMRFSFLILVTLWCSIAHAESTAEAMKEFGLLGTWSVDCAKDVKQACDPKDECINRKTYTAPWFGIPMLEVTASTFKSGVTQEAKMVIKSATRITNDKIKVTIVISGQPDYMEIYRAHETMRTVAQWYPLNGQTWSSVIQKVGEKIRTIDSRREDGKAFQIKDGLGYRHASSTENSQTEWISTGKSAPFFEKCLN